MKTQVRDMTKGAYAPMMLAFALPLMLGNIFQQLYTVSDAAIVGRFVGVTALASIGAADWMNWGFLGIIMGFTQGFSILVSQYFGANDKKGLSKTIGNSLTLCVILAVIMSIVGQIMVKPLLILLNTPDGVLEGAVLYVRIFFIGIPIVTAYNFFSGVLRALGNSKTPLIAMVIASVINISLDLGFILIFNWGIAGAAIATVTAQLFSAIFCYIKIRKIDIIEFNKEHYKLDKNFSEKLLKLGFPIASMNVIIAVGGIAIQSIVNKYGVSFIAGYTATNKLYGLLEIAALSLSYSASTFAGQNLGAKKFNRIRKGTLTCLYLALASSVVITAVMILFGKNILSLFVASSQENAAEVIKIGYEYLVVMASSLASLYTLYTIRSTLQGLGNTLIPMLSGIAELVMRLAAVIFLPRFVDYWGIFIAEPLAWIAAALLLVTSYIKTVRSYPKEDI